jgi:hypothetical protein
VLGTSIGKILGDRLDAKDGRWLDSTTLFGASSTPYPSACSVDIAYFINGRDEEIVWNEM